MKMNPSKSGNSSNSTYAPFCLRFLTLQITSSPSEGVGSLHWPWPPHSRRVTIEHPTRLALPPVEVASVAPQTKQPTMEVARSNITCSVPQSLHATRMNPLDISIPLVVHEFEFLRTLTWRIVRFSGLRATVEDVHSLGGLLSALGLRAREPSVPRCDAAEAALSPLQFTRSLLLHTFHGVQRVLACGRAVALDLSWALDHVSTPRASEPPWVRISKVWNRW